MLPRDFVQRTQHIEVQLAEIALLRIAAVFRQMAGCLRVDGLAFAPAESAVAAIDAHFAIASAASYRHIDRQRIEKLVGEEHALEAPRQRTAIHIDGYVAELAEEHAHLFAARAHLDQREAAGRAQILAQAAHVLPHQQTEGRLQLLGGVEITRLAEGIVLPAIVAVFRMIERRPHVAAERDRAAGADLRGEKFCEWSYAHRRIVR